MKMHEKTLKVIYNIAITFFLFVSFATTANCLTASDKEIVILCVGDNITAGRNKGYRSGIC